MGPYDNNYLKTDAFAVDSTVWSPCGKEGMLNINSEIRIAPLVSPNPALMTVSSPIILRLRVVGSGKLLTRIHQTARLGRLEVHSSPLSGVAEMLGLVCLSTSSTDPYRRVTGAHGIHGSGRRRLRHFALLLTISRSLAHIENTLKLHLG